MDKRIVIAYDIIKKRYQEKLLLETIAQEVGLSPFYFQRLFKKEMKESPTECINRIRLERAMHLMAIDYSLSITDIAYDCGFSSPAVFTRSFVKRFSKTPKEYSNAFRLARNPRPLKPEVSELIIEDKEIVYFPGCWLFYAHTNILWSNLMETFHSVKAFSELEQLKGRTDKLFGLFTHIHLAFHGDREQLNYYAGVKLSSRPPKKFEHRIFWIPEGKYACFTTDTSYEKMFALKVRFKAEFMDKQGLQIRDPFAFEHIFESNTSKDYPCFKRRIYTPVY